MAIPIKTTKQESDNFREYTAYSDTCWKMAKNHCEKSDGG